MNLLKMKLILGGAVVVFLTTFLWAMLHFVWLEADPGELLGYWYFLVLFLGLFLLPLWVFLNRWIFHPLKYLEQSNREVVQGNLGAAIILDENIPKGEVGTLMRSRNTMLNALIAHQRRLELEVAKREHAEEALRKAYAELELRVEERTAELKTVNEQLQREITERNEMEHELVRLERLRAVGELAAGISHNLNNILTGILMPAQLLYDSIDDPEERRGVEHVVTSAERARDLVHRLYLSTRGEEKDILQPVNVNAAVLEAVKAARPRWKDELGAMGINIEVVTGLEEIPAIMGNASELHDLFINLLFNAVDAMRKGGTITIRTQAVADDVRITVCDTGIGMDEETRLRVFEPFFTTKMDIGSGLGLSTAYSTVTRWGGDIAVDSTPGEGTTFTIRLPGWTEPVAKMEAEAEARPARRARILLAEDEAVVGAVLSDFLKKNGHEVTRATNGAEALARFSPGRYDVVLIDLGMSGMPGDRVALEIREADPRVATVLITGWNLPEEDPRLSSFDFHLRKPLTVVGVENALAHAVELRDERADGG